MRAMLLIGTLITMPRDGYSDDPVWRVEDINDQSEYVLKRINPKILKETTFIKVTSLDQKIKNGIVFVVNNK